MGLMVLCAAFAFAALCGSVMTEANADFILAADMSYLPMLDCHGECSPFRSSASGPTEDALKILAAAGINTVRMRLWVDPSSETADGWPTKDYSYANLSSVLALARRVHGAGLRVWLDFHYSDVWADPGHQTKPARWRGLDMAALQAAVHNHTATALAALAGQGTPAAVVQVGNEISSGMLWAADGQPCSAGGALYKPGCEGDGGHGGERSSDSSQSHPDSNSHGRSHGPSRGAAPAKGNWPVFGSLVAAGLRATRATAPDALLMIHTALGDRLHNSSQVDFLISWYQDLVSVGAGDWDAIGLSFYPRWSGNTTNLAHLSQIAAAFPGKRVIIAETAYAYQNGTGGQFPTTPAGQRQYICSAIAQARSAVGGQGGIAWWGTEYYNQTVLEGWTSLWDEQAVALPALVSGWKAPC